MAHAGRQRQEERERRDADGDAEHRERERAARARQVLPHQRYERARGHDTNFPSSSLRTRDATDETRSSCVTMTSGHPLVVERAEQLDDLRARLRVEVAGRLVAQEQLRRAVQRARDGHALLLPAGERARGRPGLVADADALERRHRARVVVGVGAAAVAEIGGQLHVLAGAQVVEEVERLEDEADLAVAKARQAAIVERVQIVAEHVGLAGVAAVEAAHDVQERRLARAGAADEREQLARFDGERDVAQDGLRAVALGHRLQTDHARVISRGRRRGGRSRPRAQRRDRSSSACEYGRRSARR